MALTATSCANSGSEPRPNTAQANQDTVKTVGATLGSFAYDLNFLKTHDSALVHLRRGDAQLLASAQYQGKVFTSTADGLNGHSFGWVNYRAFEGAPGLHMNAYGGENRLWLGPEGGKFSLFFHPGAKMEFSNWKTPPGFDSEPWELAS
ncbi:MAG: hypothetical protein Q8932_20075, partial [Bacteroidota bacterium]|nr:hypothetical protein [Bacteroidota bacterium]